MGKQRKRRSFAELAKEAYIGFKIIPKYKQLDQIPNTENFKHFINCEISPDICPMIWEELEKVEEKDEKRYCKFCKNYVYKVDDKQTLQKYLNTNKCLAISENLINKLYGKWDEKVIENYKKRLLISKLFLLFKAKYKEYWNEFKKKNYDYEQILKEIFKLILDDKLDLNYFVDNEFDLLNTTDFIAENIDDEELKKKFKLKRSEIVDIQLSGLNAIFDKVKK